MHLKMQVKNRPQAEHASRLIPGGSTRLAFVLGTPAWSSGVVVAEPWCVPLVGRPLLRFGERYTVGSVRGGAPRSENEQT